MAGWMHHLIVAPIFVPLVAGALSILVGSERRRLKVVVGLVSVLLQISAGVALAAMAYERGTTAYLIGDWPSRFGIVLVLDRLSAMMVLLSATLGLAVLIYSLARWYGASTNFMALFQFQLMGLNGAFLTGDLFNLFVFFEVLLAASYGLALHGSGAVRVRAGLHYIAVNLAASSLFLIGVSLIYSATGSLNMADLAARVAAIEPGNRGLFEAGAAVLGIAFLVKAGMWPLGFWLPRTYSAASPPVAAMFAIMTKVGVYAVLRLWLLVLGDSAGVSAHFGGTWLFYGGILTIGFAATAVLASQDLARLAGASIVASSGTLLAAISFGQVDVTGGALFYLASSTLGAAAFFLLIELVERGREAGADVLAVTMEVFGESKENSYEDDVGIATPQTIAILGIAFVACALLISGLPPLSGFIGKFAILNGVFNGGNVAWKGWLFMALVIISGFAALIALTRAGMRSFWNSAERQVPQVRATEIAPIAGLLLLCVAMTVAGGPVTRYLRDAAEALHAPRGYIADVLATPHGKGGGEEKTP